MASSSELKKLAVAARITTGIYRDISGYIRPGVRESEIVHRIEYAIKKKGLKRSFKTIVASGPNASKPHAEVTQRKIRETDAVVVDFGVIYKGFHSDMTRTVLMKRVPSRIRAIHAAVKKAHGYAIRKVRPGLSIADFTRDVHGILRKRGFGKYLLHSLGHGVGKKIHQAPRLSEKNKRKFPSGVVITIEPGLYIRQKGGSRIEDMVFIGKNKKKVLTKC